MSKIDKVWLKSLAYPSGEEGGKFLVQMISTYLCYIHVEEGGRGSAPCGATGRIRVWFGYSYQQSQWYGGGTFFPAHGAY
jgi:hypothetical protein